MMISLPLAEEIFSRGTDCLGLKEALIVHGALWGENSADVVLPPLPWSQEELKAARQAGFHLVLIPPGLTMRELIESRHNRATDHGKLLGYKPEEEKCRYQNAPFFTTMTTGDRWHWRLASLKLLAGSAGKNCFEQTKLIAGCLEKLVFPYRLSAAYHRAVMEFDCQSDRLAKLMEGDQLAATRELMALQLNQLCREPPVITLYRLITDEATNDHRRLLESEFNLTSALSPTGEFFRFGAFNEHCGFNLCDWHPRIGDPSLGVILSRSSLVESEESV